MVRENKSFSSSFSKYFQENCKVYKVGVCQLKVLLVLVRALELAQLDSNRAYINALARFLPSSARLESELAQLNSNSTLQLDELDRAFRAIQLVNIGAITV